MIRRNYQLPINTVDVIELCCCCCWRILTFVVIPIAAYSTTRNVLTGGDFYELVTSDVYVDKTPMIEEYLRNPSSMFLIIRPSKWGRTTNMNMLKRFLEIEIDDSGRPLPLSERLNFKLFVGGPVPDPGCNGTREKQLKPLKISESADSMEKQGRHPVVYLSLQHARGDSCEEIEASIRRQIKHVLERQHGYLRRYTADEDDALKASDKTRLKNYFDGLYGLRNLQDFLRFLTTVLYVHYGKQAHVLIDDYDEPTCKLFVNILRQYRIEHRRLPEYLIYDKVIKSDEFVQAYRMIGAMLTPLKDNYAVDKTLISGTFLLDDLFSDAPNTSAYSLLDRQFSRWYGFTSDEVNELLAKKSLTEKSADLIPRWYSGYNAYGGNVLYNPWSVSNYVAENGTLNYYWCDGTNMLLMDDLLSKDDYTKTQVKQLMADKCIDEYIRKGIAYEHIRFDGLIHMLLFSGYLTATRNTSLEFDYNYPHPCQLTIPNEEVKHIYEDRILPQPPKNHY